MGMPTDEELREALRHAAGMREHGKDPHHVAKSLLNLNYRLKQLEKVMHAAELFLNSGLAVQEHQRLEKAIEEARRAIDRTGVIEHERLDL